MRTTMREKESISGNRWGATSGKRGQSAGRRSGEASFVQKKHEESYPPPATREQRETTTIIRVRGGKGLQKSVRVGGKEEESCNLDLGEEKHEVAQRLVGLSREESTPLLTRRQRGPSMVRERQRSNSVGQKKKYKSHGQRGPSGFRLGARRETSLRGSRAKCNS